MSAVTWAWTRALDPEHKLVLLGLANCGGMLPHEFPGTKLPGQYLLAPIDASAIGYVAAHTGLPESRVYEIVDEFIEERILVPYQYPSVVA